MFLNNLLYFLQGQGTLMKNTEISKLCENVYAKLKKVKHCLRKILITQWVIRSNLEKLCMKLGIAKYITHIMQVTLYFMCKNTNCCGMEVDTFVREIICRRFA